MVGKREDWISGALSSVALSCLLYALIILAIQTYYWLYSGIWYSAPLSEVFFPGQWPSIGAIQFDPLIHLRAEGTAFAQWLAFPISWVGVRNITDWVLRPFASWTVSGTNTNALDNVTNIAGREYTADVSFVQECSHATSESEC